jgi:hypothetical protein
VLTDVIVISVVVAAAMVIIGGPLEARKMGSKSSFGRSKLPEPARRALA